jgi:hypothetical protein
MQFIRSAGILARVVVEWEFPWIFVRSDEFENNPIIA